VIRLKQLLLTLLCCIILLFGCSNAQSLAESSPMPTVQYSKAIFAGGCFWCMEKPFDELPGVIATTSGYTGGTKTNPTYREVSSGNTGHAEAVQVSYDPKQVNYEHLLSVFWKNIDPLDSKGQFCDKGSQYRSAIFYSDDQQKALAESSKEQVANSKNLSAPIATEITAATTFYAAEDYHQNYYQTNPVKYKFYRYSCGRDRRLEEVWGSGAAK
jgi:peptide-methionine (S)-S-oxide reductase